MVWRLVRSLETLRAQVRKAAPRAVPPATDVNAWGTVGDTAHTSTSDHSPHVYSALGSTAVVCAADFPHAPALGLDGDAFTEALRRSQDPRIGYVIFNGRIFSSTNAPWTWRTYTGSDPHRDHWHVSTVHTAAADNTAAWQMPGGTATGDEMNLTDQLKTGPGAYNLPGGWTVDNALSYGGRAAEAAAAAAQQAVAEVRALRTVIEALAETLRIGGGSVDTAAILAGVDERLARLAAEQRDAVADLGEGGAAQVRGPQG